MIIWRGKGIVVALIAFGCLVLSEIVSRSAFGDEKYYQGHGWPKLIGFWVAAGLVYAFRSWFEGAKRTVVDEKTAKEIMLSSENALFFVPVRFWPPILLGLGVIFFFVRE